MDVAVRLERGLDAVARSRAASLATILLVTLLATAPGFLTLPIVDGSESAFAVGARAMADSGNMVAIQRPTAAATDQWDARGGYWVQALVVAVTGAADTIAAYRMPSLAAALAVPVAAWWAALGLIRARGAVLAALFVAASGLFNMQARLATPDMAVLLASVLAAGFLARAWRPGLPEDKRTRYALGFWGCVALAFVFGGVAAISPLLVTAGVLSFRRSVQPGFLHSKAGPAALAAAIALWVAVSLIATAGKGAGLEPAELMRLGIPSRIEAPPGTYFLLAPLLAGPALAFLFAGFIWLLENGGRPPVWFAAAWAIPPWLMAEFSPDKVAALFLAAVPGLCLLAAIATDRRVALVSGFIAWLFSLGLFVWPPLIAVGALAVVILAEGGVPVLAAVWLIAGAVAGSVAWWWLFRRYAVGSAVLAVAMSMLIIWGLFGSLLPHIGGLRVAERLNAATMATTGCAMPDVTVAGFAEESVTFAFNGAVRFVDTEAAVAFLAADGACRVAVVDRGLLASFRQRADDLGIVVVDNARVAGVNLRKLDLVELHLFTRSAGEGS